VLICVGMCVILKQKGMKITDSCPLILPLPSNFGPMRIN
jgi:hypothetical protein